MMPWAFPQSHLGFPESPAAGLLARSLAREAVDTWGQFRANKSPWADDGRGGCGATGLAGLCLHPHPSITQTSLPLST